MSWKKTKISDKCMTFVSILFNIKKYLILADQVFNETHLQSLDFVEDDIDTKRKSENIKFTKLVSIYRTIFYILHAGKKKTPLHMMTTHVIYDKCKSRELITVFNHIGVSVSYRQVQKAKNNLTQYTLMQCEKVLVPIPSHFSKNMFILAALENFDHQDRSPSSGMNSNHGTVLILFQIKPGNTPSKPLKSSLSLKTVSDSSSLVFSSQKVIPFKDKDSVRF